MTEDYRHRLAGEELALRIRRDTILAQIRRAELELLRLETELARIAPKKERGVS